eukprot:scaffold291310_cov31-Tisochrysis_lutea.AAC.6
MAPRASKCSRMRSVTGSGTLRNLGFKAAARSTASSGSTLAHGSPCARRLKAEVAVIFDADKKSTHCSVVAGASIRAVRASPSRPD